MSGFKIDFLDHVAIRVKNMAKSIAWYEKVIGLKLFQLPEWGEYPVFLLAGKTGIALFPANPDDDECNRASKNVKIDHFAFNVNQENYQKAKLHWKALNIKFEEQDHHNFHSIYTKDPDGHQVELTTPVRIDKSTVYG